MNIWKTIGITLLFLICGSASFVWSWFICYAFSESNLRSTNSPPLEALLHYLGLWSAPLILGGIFALSPLRRRVKIATVSGFCIPAVLIVPFILHFFFES